MPNFKPILFSSEMVRAILEGRKTQTRRTKGLDLINKNPNDWSFGGFGTNPNDEKDKNLYSFFKTHIDTWTYIKLPFLKDDILWVRETFMYSDNLEEPYWYRTSMEDDFSKEHAEEFKKYWKPSIHMPKEACRIFLKIKSIKVKRLQDISENDAIAEGVKIYCYEPLVGNDKTYLYEDYVNSRYGNLNAKDSFSSLWESINGKESLELNPWVWVIEFETIEKPENFK